MLKKAVCQVGLGKKARLNGTYSFRESENDLISGFIESAVSYADRTGRISDKMDELSSAECDRRPICLK